MGIPLGRRPGPRRPLLSLATQLSAPSFAADLRPRPPFPPPPPPSLPSRNSPDPIPQRSLSLLDPQVALRLRRHKHTRLLFRLAAYGPGRPLLSLLSGSARHPPTLSHWGRYRTIMGWIYRH